MGITDWAREKLEISMKIVAILGIYSNNLYFRGSSTDVFSCVLR